MKKISQLILTSLALVLLIVSPACRTKKQVVTAPKDATATMTVPDVDPPPPLPQETPVEDTRDFVQDTPRELGQGLPGHARCRRGAHPHRQLRRRASVRGRPRRVFVVAEPPFASGPCPITPR